MSIGDIILALIDVYKRQVKAQSRHKNAPALDLARECGIILLKGNAVYSGQTLSK